MTAESGGFTEFHRAARAKSAANHSRKRLVVLGENAADTGSGFREAVLDAVGTLQRAVPETLQVNLGKMCNLTCGHCHVEAGPGRTEVMTPELMALLVEVARRFGFRTVDLTGGAPEMCPSFKQYVREFRSMGLTVLVRSNLSILLQPGYESMIEFFREQSVHVIASLPCYTKDTVDAQRGDGVFEESIAALKKLNAVGYGQPGSNLELDLVYNPGGPVLPGPQQALEAAYKEELSRTFGIVFNRLFTITNLPIGRFYSELKQQGRAERYEELLRQHFNPLTLPHLMCRSTVSVSWDGWLYDCDFNQMIELPFRSGGRPLHARDLLSFDSLEGLPIAVGDHCFGCTAGSGSSCGGELL
ncbi:MAG: arsenosugar biosynthesis radical SAM protein ArsS [Bdellovibrionales bacterium]|nr:arsenosugar biosynthesis radical SAM protein ArsS [Bdellovibrionales bacterium]